jgi:hypothetical protein
MNTFFSKSIMSGVTLGGLAVALLAGAGPAEARPMSCLAKYQGCNQRCAAAAGSQGDWVPCIQRTCNRQYDNCVGAGGRGGRRGFVANLQQPGPVASGPQSPRRPGNSGPFVPGGRNPTGGIVPDGRNPTGGIVPGGMGRNGGFGSGGAIFRSAWGRR